MKKIFLYATIIFFATALCASAAVFQSVEQRTTYYKERYKALCANEKITDNFGNGFDSLYGTRNMRTILYGIAYRGGANNFYNKYEKRDNQNPLTDEALQNLCNEGFDMAVYLYGKNFNAAKKVAISGTDTLHYIQNSGMSRTTQREIMDMVKQRIDNPDAGPLYFHCWNGWHQSGYVSAIILMQFCDFTKEQAREYWEMNTDGAYKKFDNVKKMLSNFTPFADLKIDDETQEMICPCLKK
ncbi:MAG: hypothetical protein LBO69_00410 [Ignavibacteria bacterium]|jgi:hypothetical protein|nr:hypothetical protein [Ignavibacteria bacterium]